MHNSRSSRAESPDNINDPSRAGDRRLWHRAESAIRRAAGKDGVWISAISMWEVAKKVEKRQLTLDCPFRRWLEATRVI